MLKVGGDCSVRRVVSDAIRVLGSGGEGESHLLAISTGYRMG